MKTFLASFVSFLFCIVYCYFSPGSVYGACSQDLDCATCEVCKNGICIAMPACPPSCFTADTKIATPGGEKEIKDIKEGDVVKSFDPKTGKIRESTVTALHKRQVSGYYILKTGSGKEIKVTGEHPILVLDENGKKVWRKVEDIKEGDTSFVLDERGNVIEKTEESQPLPTETSENKETPDLLGDNAHRIITKKILEENGQKYVLLKLDNGEERKLPADQEIVKIDGKFILDPVLVAKLKKLKNQQTKTSFLQNLFSSLRNLIQGIF